MENSNVHRLIPYVMLPGHPDPLFNGFTYGDLGQRGNQLKTFKKGSYIFFHTSRYGKKFVTAYYVVDRAMDIATAVEDKLISVKYKKPHIQECLTGERKIDDSVILFGDPIAIMQSKGGTVR